MAEVMGWTPEDVARERPSLQGMAEYKYDEYQQFYPGMRFVESLALWLRQFNAGEERRIAYDFVRKRLIFFSSAEMAHLISIAYPDCIRPLLLRRAALAADIPEKYISRVADSIEYRELRRRSLFLGLSDGSHIDNFRRYNNSELSHEQIWQTYDISGEKADDMLKELSKDLRLLSKPNNGDNECYFKMVFLLDDFSGSGISYIRNESESGESSGKIAKLCRRLVTPDSDLSKLIRMDDLFICVVLYVATQKAVTHLRGQMDKLFDGKEIQHYIHVLQTIEDDVPLRDGYDDPFLRLVDDERYYDAAVETEATGKGGTGVKRGFANCALPLVLSHNTPNNSVFLLWANSKSYEVRGLFPRIERHRGEA